MKLLKLVAEVKELHKLQAVLHTLLPVYVFVSVVLPAVHIPWLLKNNLMGFLRFVVVVGKLEDLYSGKRN